MSLRRLPPLRGCLNLYRGSLHEGCLADQIATTGIDVRLREEILTMKSSKQRPTLDPTRRSLKGLPSAVQRSHAERSHVTHATRLDQNLRTLLVL